MANFFIKRKKLTVPPIDRQAERIVELKQEIERLNVELERYRARENEISRSLLVAKELAERYEGGGHACACGATVHSKAEMKALIKDADELLKNYKATNEGWI